MAETPTKSKLMKRARSKNVIGKNKNAIGNRGELLYLHEDPVSRPIDRGNFGNHTGEVREVVSCDQETQTRLDEASRFYFEETHDLKLQIFRLTDQVKVLERKN